MSLIVDVKDRCTIYFNVTITQASVMGITVALLTSMLLLVNVTDACTIGVTVPIAHASIMSIKITLFASKVLIVKVKGALFQFSFCTSSNYEHHSCTIVDNVAIILAAVVSFTIIDRPMGNYQNRE